MTVLRRTQAERASDTKNRILNAALDVILEQGFRNASTAAITNRAGVSRGALMHHFPSKFGWISATFEQLLDQERQEIESMAERVSSGALTLNDLLDDIWNRMSGRLFMITIDYVATARTDDELREHIIPMSLEFNQKLNDIWQKLFSRLGLDGTQTALLFDISLCFLRGMGVQTITRDDPEYFEKLLSAWKDMLPAMIDARGKSKSNI